MVRYAIIDDTDPRLVYTGNWNVLRTPTNLKTPEYNGTVHATTDPTATISFNWTGGLLDVFGTLYPGTIGYPNASFTVDGSSTTQHLNETGAVTPLTDLTTATTHIRLFRSGTLRDGNHNMTIVADGVRGDGGPTFYFDFLRIAVPTEGTFENIAVDDSDTQWVYTSNWVKGAHVGEYLDSWHATPLDGGMAQLAFYGTHIKLYAALSGEYEPDLTLAVINVDDEPGHTITLQNSNFSQDLGQDITLRNQLIFATEGMADKGATPRTLTVSIPFITSTPSPLPIITAPSWFIDYAIYGPYLASSSVTDVPPSSFLPSQTTSSQSTSASAEPTQGGSSSMTQGAIAGVVVGVLALVGIIVAALLLWLRKRRRDNPGQDATVRHEFPSWVGTASPVITLGPSGGGAAGVHQIQSPVLDISPQAAGFPQDGNHQPDSPSTWIGGRDSKSRMHYSNAPLTASTLGAGLGGGIGQAPSSGSGSSGARSPTVISSGVGGPMSQHSGTPLLSPPGVTQELDGGVRLATSSTYGSEPEVLPPRYAPYDS
ncbi:hypothetical protein M408DRAFT_8923 [Serendipita vermifera MAFF 305830]|uniref:Transmembrane protein n=1 Tax=Serendipita vermifera MAFF 305830 TaxID=933852 RepID=A0A0C2WPY5_SERVB|nr:hypothetical protein M408DRAFT_8923 [Serendipita vermifera MAFF 305830]